MEEFKVVNINVDSKYKIKRKNLNWDEIIEDIDEELYNKIVDIIFDESNLFYYTTAREETKKYIESLNQEDKEDAILSFMELIKNPEDCRRSNDIYNSFLNYIDLLDEQEEELTEIQKKEMVLEFLENLEIVDIDKKKNYKSILKLAKAKLSYESRNGIFAEVLFYRVVDALMDNSNVLFSKIPAITAAGTYAHGADGIFIEIEDGEICLGFGEAKFCNSIDNAIAQVQKSISDFARLGNDVSWMSRNLITRKSYSDELESALESIQINDFIKGLHLKKIDINKVRKKIFVFMLYGEGNYELNDLKEKLKNKKIELENFEVIIICFPIIKKRDLVTKIVERIDHHVR